jgi:hypothetical protein
LLPAHLLEPARLRPGETRLVVFPDVRLEQLDVALARPPREGGVERGADAATSLLFENVRLRVGRPAPAHPRLLGADAGSNPFAVDLGEQCTSSSSRSIARSSGAVSAAFGATRAMSST